MCTDRATSLQFSPAFDGKLRPTRKLTGLVFNKRAHRNVHPAFISQKPEHRNFDGTKAGQHEGKVFVNTALPRCPTFQKNTQTRNAHGDMTRFKHVAWWMAWPMTRLSEKVKLCLARGGSLQEVNEETLFVICPVRRLPENPGHFAPVFPRFRW